MAEKSLKECLTEARALLARKGGWIQMMSAENSKGQMVSPFDEQAVKFCMVGALHHTCNNPEVPTPEYLAALRILGACVQRQRGYKCIEKQRGGKNVGIVDWNDAPHRKKAQVLKVMDCAIRAAE